MGQTLVLRAAKGTKGSLPQPQSSSRFPGAEGYATHSPLLALLTPQGSPAGPRHRNEPGPDAPRTWWAVGRTISKNTTASIHRPASSRQVWFSTEVKQLQLLSLSPLILKTSLIISKLRWEIVWTGRESLQGPPDHPPSPGAPSTDNQGGERMCP